MGTPHVIEDSGTGPAWVLTRHDAQVEKALMLARQAAGDPPVSPLYQAQSINVPDPQGGLGSLKGRSNGGAQGQLVDVPGNAERSADYQAALAAWNETFKRLFEAYMAETE